VGHWIVSIANVGFVFLIFSGAWLWWPKHWHWKALRNSIAIRLDVRGKARDWNWHNALAFWFFLPLAFIALTGVVLSFGVVDQWWKDFASANLLAPSLPPNQIDPPAAAPGASDAIGWLRIVRQRYPAWRSVMLNGSGKPNSAGQLSLTVHEGMPRHRLSNWSVKVDAQTNAIVQEGRWSSEEAKNRARAIARLGHSGELFGFWGQALAFLACMAGLVMVYTGFALSWRRFVPRRKPRLAPVASPDALTS
jgi:uncharacterized iron-regulated membrane protein